MRQTPIAAAVCLLAAASLVALSAHFAAAQSGGKKHHAADSGQTSKSDQTIQTGQTVGSFALKSDKSPSSDLTLKSGTTVSSSETPAEETTPIMHVPASRFGTIGINWELNHKRGFVELTLLRDGNWHWRGSFVSKASNRDLEVVIALKDESGAVFIFHSVGPARKGNHLWGTGNIQSFYVSQYFNSLLKGFEARAAYRLPTAAEGTAEQKAATSEGRCETTATVASGWAPIWTWVEPHHQCFQFNSAY